MMRIVPIVASLLITALNPILVQSNEPVNIRVGLLVGSQRWKYDPTYSSSGKFLRYVFNYAIDKINRVDDIGSHNNGSHQIVRYQPIVGETHGNESESIRKTIELIIRHKVDIVLGPQETCAVEPKIASIYNVPVISHYCSFGASDTDAAAVAGKWSHASSTGLIRTKPSKWKLAERVAVVVESLLALSDWYAQKLVLLYYKPKRADNGNEKNRTGETAGAPVNPSEAHAATDKSQYTIVGELLEIRLRDLLMSVNEGRMRSPSTRPSQTGIGVGSSQHSVGQSSVGQPKGTPARATTDWRQVLGGGGGRNSFDAASLAVLNWERALPQAGRNVFQKLLRRHLFARRADSAERCSVAVLGNEQANRAKYIGQKIAPTRTASSAQVSGARCSVDNNCGGGGASVGSAGATEHGAIYIVVGHFYEHLRLMLALDQLQVFDDGGGVVGNGAANDTTEPPPPPQQQPERGADSAGSQSSVVEAIASSIRGNQRHSVVVGVDIEPHDEHDDDSVRFLPDAGRYAAEPSARAYGRYISIAPSKPTNMEQILDAMQRFYNASSVASAQLEPTLAGGGADKGRGEPADANLDDDDDAATGRGGDGGDGGNAGARPKSGGANAAGDAAESSVKLTARRLKLIRLPLEAFYLLDSVELIAKYFDECVRLRGAAQVRECKGRQQMHDWFRSRAYTSSVNGGATLFDSSGESEGVFSIAMRTSPTTDALTGDELSEQPELSQVAEFVASATRGADPETSFRIEFSNEKLHSFGEQIDPIWWPFLCQVSGEHLPQGSQLEDRCRTLLADFLQLNRSKTISEAEERLIRANGFTSGPMDELRRLILSSLTYALVAALVCAPLALALICHCCNGQRLKFATSGQSSSASNGWFNERDEQNFLRIVHNLLLVPETDQLNRLNGLNSNGRDDCDNNNNNNDTDNIDVNVDVDADVDATDDKDNDDSFGDAVRDDAIDDDYGANEISGNNNVSADTVAHESEDFSTPLDCSSSASMEISRFSTALNTSTCNSAHQQQHRQQQQQQQQHRSADHIPMGRVCARNAVSVELIHCFMFPFPSCKFVHWLTALHQLKELLFQYKTQMLAAESCTSDRRSRSVRRFTCAERNRSKRWRRRRQRCARRESCVDLSAQNKSQSGRRFGGLACSAAQSHLLTTAANCHRLRCQNVVDDGSLDNKIDGSDWLLGQSGRRFEGASKAAAAPAFEFLFGCAPIRTLKRSLISCAAKLALSRKGGPTTNLRLFFTGHHKATPSVRLLLNKFKSTNACLCDLAELRHENLVELRAITLGHSADVVGSRASTIVGNRCALLVLTRPSRGNLRLAMDSLRLRLDADCCDRFKSTLIRSLVGDILAGLEHLHRAPRLGFHGNLAASTCMVTADWRVQLTGFHTIHLQRSLGDYIQRDLSAIESDASHELRLKALLYLAPECIVEWRRKCALSSHQMRVADIYSFAFILYELLVGQEPWKCATSVTSSKLLLERIKVDPNFRPPPLLLDPSRLNAAGRAATRLLHERRVYLLGRLLESSWSHRPNDRPQSVGSVRALFESAYGSKLDINCSFASPTNKTPTTHRCCAAAAADVARWPPPTTATTRATTTTTTTTTIASNPMQLYVRLLERSSLSRLERFELSQTHNNQLEWSQLPASIVKLLEANSSNSNNNNSNNNNDNSDDDTGASHAPQSAPPLAAVRSDLVFRHFESISVLVFKFAFSATSELASQPQDRNESGGGGGSIAAAATAAATAAGQTISQCHRQLLAMLDKLVAMYYGHVHLLSSELDSGLRFAVVAGEPLADAWTRPMRRKNASHTNLVASFALQLIDFVENKWTAEQVCHLTVRVGAHCGPAFGYLIGCGGSNGGGGGGGGLLARTRLILNGPAMQVAHLLEQTGKPQHIHVSRELRNELETSPRWLALRVAGDCNAATSDDAAELATRHGWRVHAASGQAGGESPFVLRKRSIKIACDTTDLGGFGRARDLETHWLLNGPRLTTSQSLMLCAQTPRQLLES